MIALSAVGCAMAAIAVVVQAYVPVSVALNVVAALFVALPLTRGYWGGALLAYVSAALIGFFTVNIQALPFILLFGPYTVVMWLLDFKFYEFTKLPKWAKIVIITLVKIGYFFTERCLTVRSIGNTAVSILPLQRCHSQTVFFLDVPPCLCYSEFRLFIKSFLVEFCKFGFELFAFGQFKGIIFKAFFDILRLDNHQIILIGSIVMQTGSISDFRFCNLSFIIFL